MVEDTNKDYRDTMQEIMLELKLSTNTFLKKVKEKNKDTEYDNLEIPIIISSRKDHHKFEIDLFGVGEKIQTNMMLSYPNPRLNNIRLVNQNAPIVKGVTLQHGKKLFFDEESVEKVEFPDYHYILFISKNMLSSGVNVNVITDWFSEKILKKECKLIIKEKEVVNQEELQTILNDIIFNYSS